MPFLQEIKSAFTRFKVNEDGNVAVMMAVGGLALLAMVGLAVDTLGARNAQQELQSHLDAVSMAVATSGIEDPAERLALAQGLLRANEYEIDPANLSIQVAPDGEVSVTGRTEYELALGGVFNKDKLDVSANSSAIAGASVSDPVDVVLVLDTTGSMAGAKMAALQSSANLLIDTLGGGGGGQVQMGVVPFACLLYTSPSPRDQRGSRMPSSA